MTKIRAGIDPGKSGFVTVNIDSQLEFYPLPTIGKEYDFNELNLIFKTFSQYKDVMFCIENIHGRGGVWSATTNFELGKCMGMLTAFATAHGISYEMVSPAKWQKVAWEGVPVIKKSSSTGKKMVTDTKKMSEIAVKRLYPNIDYRRTERSRVNDDNKIDSILIMHYCKQKYR